MSIGQNEKWNSNQLIKIPRKKIKTLVFQALNPFPPGQLSCISCRFHVVVTDTEGWGEAVGKCGCRHRYLGLSSYFLLCLVKKQEHEKSDWMKHKLESRLLGETSITPDMQTIPPFW